MSELDKNLQVEIEAQVFRDLVAHLQSNTELQNIDLMNLAGFCRNCLAKWYQKAADRGDSHAIYKLKRMADNDCIANRTRKRMKQTN